jgi:diketogulonate reductase-like aldo/keto reductase
MRNTGRRDILKTVGLVTLGSMMPVLSSSSFAIQPMKRKIYKGNEEISCIGLGTWQTFDVGESSSARDPLREVLRTLVTNGASVVDSSPMYGSSEKVVGDLSTLENLNEKLFMATKVWTTGKQEGIRQMENSFSLLRRRKMDLMQIHNLVDWKTHIKTLREWKESGKIRYIGLTHYTDSAHPTLESIIKAEPIDFIQINYSLRDRNAEKSLLPTAREKEVAVLINRPFEEGALFNLVKGKALPEWVAAFDCKSWGQFFLKFILANQAVTCVIPGTSKPKHLLDNLEAGQGKLPDAKQREQMIRFFN